MGRYPPWLVTREEQSFVLIDGYLRLQAVAFLGMDVLDAEVRDESEADMLAVVLSKSQERQWESVEQGFLIRDLTIIEKGLTWEEILMIPLAA